MTDGPSAPFGAVAWSARPGMLALVACVSGCGAGGPPRGEPVVRDSAGIAIVENASPDDSLAYDWWRVEGPRLDIGGEDRAGHDLFRVSAALNLDDGRVVVADRGMSELRFFDPSGSLLSVAGGRGEGPGEFRNITWLAATGDSLFVFDGSAVRMSVFSLDGRFVRDFGFGGQASRATAIGLFADGSFAGRETVLLQTDGGGLPPAGLQRPEILVVRLARAGELLDTLGRFPGAERHISVNMEGGQTAVQILTPLLARTPSHVVLADRLWSGTQDAAELRVFRRDGRLLRIVRTGRAPEPVTDRHREALIAKRLESVPDDRRVAVRAGLEELAVADFVPPYGGLVGDRAGNLWVADYDDGLGPAGRWTVYAADGRALARIALPERFTPYDIATDWILGKELDDLEIEHVRLYQLVRN